MNSSARLAMRGHFVVMSKYRAILNPRLLPGVYNHLNTVMWNVNSEVRRGRVGCYFEKHRTIPFCKDEFTYRYELAYSFQFVLM